MVSYDTPRGCAAAYYPETNPLVPLDSTAEGSNTPASKSVVIRLEPATATRAGVSRAPDTGAVATGDKRSTPHPPELTEGDDRAGAETWL